MTLFNLNKEEILAPQDWGFPVPIAYGPGRFSEIGNYCSENEITNPLIVTDSGSVDLPFIDNLVEILKKSKRMKFFYYFINRFDSKTWYQKHICNLFWVKCGLY